MARPVSAARWAGGVLLTLVTLLFLASIGGGMLYVWWMLVPLHWMAARRAGPVATGWWAFLAGASLAEVGMLVTYIVSENEAAAALVGLACFVGTGLAFVVARAGRQPASSS
jgi:hypothetical protein